MRIKGKIGILLVPILAFAFAFVEISHRLRFGHFAPPGLHADVLTRKANSGIPRPWTAYEARLTNFGVVPGRITVCDFESDIGLTLTLVGSRFEEWDPAGNQWRSEFMPSNPLSCPPVPLRMAKTHVVSRELWPGQSVPAAVGAIAVFDGPAAGGKVRIVVLPRNGRTIPTAAFTIGEPSAR